MLGEIVLFAGNKTPRGWKRCDGSALSTVHFRALFELIGTTYGGDSTAFNLPNLGGRYIIDAEGAQPDLRYAESWDLLAAPGADAPVQYVQSVSYAQLIGLMDNSSLVPGKQYLISDFAARWFMQDNQNPISGSEQTGVAEPIIVTAIAANRLHRQCISTLYSSDVLEYEARPDSFLTVYSPVYTPANPYYVLSGSIISGFKGVITRRIDLVNSVDACFDWRNLTFRRWALNLPAWSNATAYVVGDSVKHNNFWYVCIQAHTNQTPAGTTAYWKQFLTSNISTDPYWSGSSAGFVFYRGASTYTCPVSASYLDYKVFSGYGVSSVRLGLRSIGNVFKQGGHFASYNFTIGEDCTENTVGSGFINNTVLRTFRYNVMGPAAQGNQIGADFLNNCISGSFHRNVVADGFRRNWMDSCDSNYFGYSFASNIAKIGFNNHRIGGFFQDTDYTSSTLVYGGNGATLQKSPDNSKWLTYVNNSGVSTTVSHTT